MVVAVVAMAAILPLGGEPVNLALRHPVNASQSQPDGPPTAAVDGTWDTELIWNSGDFATQWIEVDLGAPSTITGVRLHVAQFPAGQTHHRVFGRAAESGPEVLLHEFVGVTADPGILEATLEPAVPGIRFVRVETLTSPSFVAWREVEVLGRP